MFFSRGKNKIQDPYTIPDMYISYISKVEKGSPYDIPYSLYKDIVISYNKKIHNHLLDGMPYKLPYKLGTLQIIKKKMYYKSQINKKRGIDWALTTQYKKVIHHLNEHSDGYKFLFFWDRFAQGGIKQIGLYRLVPVRTLKRTLASLIKDCKKDYFEV